MLNQIMDRQAAGKTLHVGSTSHQTQSAKLVKGDTSTNTLVDVFSISKDEFHQIIPKAKALSNFDLEIIMEFVKKEQQKKSFDTKEERKKFILGLLKTNIDVVANATHKST